MLHEKNFKDAITVILIIGLFILTYLILRPIIFSIVFAILLAYILYPVYSLAVKIVKNERIAAFLICALILIIVLIPAIFFLGTLINQAVDFYLVLQKIDLAVIFKNLLPSSLSPELYSTIIASLNNFIPKAVGYFIGRFSSFVMNLPGILLQIFVVLFVFYFSLKDGKEAIKYLKSLSPLSKEVENKFFQQFQDITNSVLLGFIVVGIIQGIVAGIGYFVLGVPKALFLTLLTMLAAIIPMVGPWLVWLPVDIYLFSAGKTGAAIGLLLYGTLVISLIDNILRPMIVSRRTEMNSAIVVIGMIGGLFVFGFLGIIIGPLILGYVILVLEIYRKKKISESVFLKEVKEEPTIKIP